MLPTYKDLDVKKQEEVRDNIKINRLEGNSAYYDALRQMHIGAIYIISLSPIIFINDKIFHSLNKNSLYYISAIAFSICSFLCGIAQLVRDKKHNHSYANILEKYKKGKQLSKDENDIFNRVNKQDGLLNTGEFWWYLQCSFLLISLISFFIFIYLGVKI